VDDDGENCQDKFWKKSQLFPSVIAPHATWIVIDVTGDRVVTPQRGRR
jgi:hypothetical protein